MSIRPNVLDMHENSDMKGNNDIIRIVFDMKQTVQFTIKCIYTHACARKECTQR